MSEAKSSNHGINKEIDLYQKFAHKVKLGKLYETLKITPNQCQAEMIEDIDCIENVDAVDGRLKADKLPERFKKKDDWETICKKCKWHNY